MVTLRKHITPIRFFGTTVPLKSGGIVEGQNFFLQMFHSFCVHGEYAESIFKHLMENAESIYAYMEKMANWGYLRCTKSSPNTRKVFKRIRRIRGKNLCVHGEDAKTYSPNTPKDIKVCLSWLIIIRILHFLDSFYLHYMGWTKPKNHLTLLSL